MANIKDLIQFYYCSACDDFYLDRAILLNFDSYLMSDIQDNKGNCPKNHQIEIDKECFVYLLDKPVKHPASSVICLDIVGFSRKSQIEQFNNASVLNAAIFRILSTSYDRTTYIYKNTGDGFLLVLKGLDVGIGIRLVEELVTSFLVKTEFIKYRVGIDFANVFSYVNLDDRVDFFGQSIIDATRIAAFGLENSVLLSAAAAYNLFDVDCQKRQAVTELGYCFDKNRIPYKIFNYWSQTVGAPFESR